MSSRKFPSAWLAILFPLAIVADLSAQPAPTGALPRETESFQHGKLVDLVEVLGTYKLAPPSWAHSAAFTPDGTRLWTAEDARLRSWDVSSGRLLSTRSIPPFWGHILALSPCGDRLAVGGRGRPVRIESVRDGSWTTLEGSSTGTTCLAFSPDGTTLAAGDPEGWVTLWDVESGADCRTVRVDRGPVNALYWATGGHVAAVSGVSLSLWDPSGRALRYQRRVSDSEMSTVMLRDRKRIVTLTQSYGEPGCVRVFDVTTGALTREFSVDESASGILVCGADDRHVLARSWRELHSIDLETGVATSLGARSPAYRPSATCAPDGRIVAFAGSIPLEVVDSKTGRDCAGPAASLGRILALETLPDGSVLAASARTEWRWPAGAGAREWLDSNPNDSAGTHVLRTARGGWRIVGPGDPNSETLDHWINWSSSGAEGHLDVAGTLFPDGRLALLRTRWGFVLGDLVARRAVSPAMKGHDATLRGVALDGRRYALTRGPRGREILEVREACSERLLASHPMGARLRALMFLPEQEALVVALDCGVGLWSPRSGSFLTLATLADPIGDLMLLRDSKTVLSRTAGGVQVWRLDGPGPAVDALSFAEAQDGPTSLCEAPDGSGFLVGTARGVILRYRFRDGPLPESRRGPRIARLCDVVSGETQPGDPEETGDADTEPLAPAPEDQQIKIEYWIHRARERSAAGDWAGSVHYFQAMVEGAGEYLVEAEPGIHRPAAAWASDALRRMARPGRREYERCYGSKAEAAFLHAVADRDPQAAIAVAERFPGSVWGAEAALHATNRLTERGQVVEAARMLRVARAFAEGGDEATGEAPPRGVDSPAARPGLPEGTWSSLGGDARRSAQATDWIGRPDPAFTVPRPPGSLLERVSDEDGYQDIDVAWPTHLATADGLLFVSNGLRIDAYEASACDPRPEPVWTHAVAPQFTSLIVNAPRGASAGATLAGGRLVAPLVRSRGVDAPLREHRGRRMLVRRALVALEPETGRRIWMTGGDARGKDFAERASYECPPAEVDGDLLATGWDDSGDDQRIEFRLCRLRGETGEMVWSTRLGVAPELDEECVSPVTVDGELAIATAHCGFVAAVEVRSGRLEWWRRTHPLPPASREGYVTRDRPAGWSNGPILARGGLVYVAPADSRHLYALERDTGRIAWCFRRNDGVPGAAPGHERHLLGFVADRLIVGGEGCIALDARTGRREWAWHPPAGSPACGRGVCTTQGVLFPTHDAVFRIGQDGIERGRLDLGSGGGGNLLAVDGWLASAAEREVRVFFDAPALLDRIGASHATAPGLRVASALLQARTGAGERGEAELAAEVRRSNGERARRALWRLRMSQGGRTWESDPAGARRAFERAAEEAPDRECAERARLALASGCLRSGDFAEARRRIEEVLAELPAGRGAPGPIWYEARDRARALRSQREGSAEAAEGDARSAYQAAVKSDLEADWTRVWQCTPDTKAAALALLETAARNRAAGHPEAAADALTLLSETPGDEAQAAALLCEEAQLLEARGAPTAAAQRWHLLALRHPDSVVHTDDDLGPAARVARSRGAALAGRAERPAMRAFPREPSWRRTNGSRLELAGAAEFDPPESGPRLAFSSESLEAFDPRSGESRWQQQVYPWIQGVQSAGGFSIAESWGCLLAYSALDGAWQWTWRYSQRRPVRARVTARRVLAFPAQTHMLAAGKVIALDLQTGRTCWEIERECFRLDCVWTGADRVVLPLGSDRLEVFDADLGRSLAEIRLPGYLEWLRPVAPDRVAAFCRGGTLIGIDVGSGREAWRHALEWSPTPWITRAGDALVLARFDPEHPDQPRFTVVDGVDGRCRTFSLDCREGRLEALAADEERIYAFLRAKSAGDEQFVLAQSIADGRRLWRFARADTLRPDLVRFFVAGDLLVLAGSLREKVEARGGSPPNPWEWRAMVSVLGLDRRTGELCSEIALPPSKDYLRSVEFAEGTLLLQFDESVLGFCAD